MLTPPLRRPLLGLLTAAAILTPATAAHAFCGFYISGADAKMFNNATMVVLMRDGQRTIQSMQNNYQGPPEDFAMVIPVPVVLKEGDVKTLDDAVFSKVDQMASPRLVEYWEQDPCYVEPEYDYAEEEKAEGGDFDRPVPTAPPGSSVRIEAQFKVGEYDIVILSATDSSALDTWLTANKYNIPKGAKESYKPYIEKGEYFFVAKVDVKKVKFADGRAKLSPLRFHYDAKDFALPVRLGLINANGPQDLIVHILARNQRYEVANYPNVTIPTNLDVTNDVRKRFGEFYAALYDKTQQKNPGAVITEYAWDASTCDPCPGPNLDGSDFLVLGADTLPDKPQYGFVLTRLHARYTRETLKDDLVFKAAPPIVGGREFLQADTNELEHGSRPDSVNNFQGRYAIRHVWEGAINCQNPIRGRWGGPPSGQTYQPPIAAQDTAFAPRGGFDLVKNIRRDAPEIDLKASVTTKALMDKLTPKTSPSTMTGPAGSGTPAAAPRTSRCTTAAPAAPAGPALAPALLLAAALGLALLRRR